MGAALHGPAALDGHDLVGVLDGREAVRDHKRGAPVRQAGERLLYRVLALVVERTRGLVQHKNLGILEEHACDGDTLLLAAGETRTALAHLGLVARRQALDEAVDVGEPGRFHDLLERGVGTSVCDVLADGAVEEVDVLLHEADRLAQALLRDVAHVLPVNLDRAFPHVIEARQ